MAEVLLISIVSSNAMKGALNFYYFVQERAEGGNKVEKWSERNIPDVYSKVQSILRS